MLSYSEKLRHHERNPLALVIVSEEAFHNFPSFSSKKMCKYSDKLTI
jgi:hypothetical protein